jgi:hypothetical protein
MKPYKLIGEKHRKPEHQNAKKPDHHNFKNDPGQIIEIKIEF